MKTVNVENLVKQIRKGKESLPRDQQFPLWDELIAHVQNHNWEYAYNLAENTYWKKSGSGPGTWGGWAIRALELTMKICKEAHEKGLKAYTGER